jgi:tetratricopeptide (TPR) repeat protein
MPSVSTVVLLTIVGFCGCRQSTVSDAPVSASKREAAKPAADHQSSLDAARRAFEAGDWDRADQLARQVLSTDPESAPAWLLAGDVAAQREQFVEALACYDRVGTDDRTTSVEAQERAARIAFYHLHRFSETERRFRRLLEAEPANTFAHGGLGYLLSICGRRWEAAPHLLHLVRQGQFTEEHLCWLGVAEAVVDEADQLRLGQEAFPDDPLPLLGLARLAVRDNDRRQAEALLRRVVAIAPELAEAQARLGRVLLREPQAAERLSAWYAQLPASVDDHPEIWVVRGLWAQQMGDQPGTIRCFGEALLRDPNRLLANYQLSQLFRRLGQRSLADRFARRARKIVDLGDALHRLQPEPDNVRAMRQAAESCQALGRPWEACAWSLVAFERDPQSTWAKQIVGQLRPKLQSSLPQTLVNAHPVATVDLSSYPLPDFARSVPEATPAGPETVASSSVRLEDEAQSVGIDFPYFNAHDPKRAAVRNYEIYGGGVAVLDYDRDGWPDLYFTQGCAWPPDEEDYTHLDRLYRNTGDGHFVDVTAEAGIRENRYSQGVAAGDFDNDGFTDLYVANIGPNRLYRNLGDGTFQEVPVDTPETGLRWTTSCLIADLNGDGSPDIYDVNYLKGDDVFERTCRYQGGVERLCAPRMFEAEQDELFVNLGDGRFRRQSREADIAVENGKGLGIVAADFDGSGTLDLFVANDQVHNFYFRNQTTPRGGAIRFSEEGLLTGLAVDCHGLGQACMGVAAGDANGDGLLDLFVTNFYNEANTLYLQEPGDLFCDVTRNAGLYDAGFRMMGFGAQFLDAELDGRPDLVLTNGHLEDQSDLDVPYRMLPQFFQNIGEGRFVQVPGDSLGRHFEQAHLGRALARLDWNRDGLEDVAVTHLHSRAALITNRTQSPGHFLAIRLCGIQSDREAVGAKVEVRAKGRSWRRQLIAGDGYLASNQKRLVFGLGDVDQVEEVRVKWPAGGEQIWRELPADSDWLLIEGLSRANRLTVHGKEM